MIFKNLTIILILASFSTIPASKGHKYDFAVNLKYFGLAMHTFPAHWDYDLAIDKKGYAVLQIGGEADLDFYLNNYFLLRASANVYKDCFNLWAGAYHFGFRANFPVGERWEFRIGIGPTVIWRQNWWKHVDRFGGDFFYGTDEKTGNFETAFLWWGGNSEMEYYLWDKTSFVLTMIPGIPQVFIFSVGVRQHF